VADVDPEDPVLGALVGAAGVGSPGEDPVPDNADSSLLQDARASRAAPNAPVRAVRRETAA